MRYQVVTPYVTLRVPDHLGKWVLTGFYKDAVLPESVHNEDAERHVRKGMIVVLDAPEPEPATVEPESADSEESKPAKATKATGR